MREIWVRSLDGEDPLEKEMATHSITLAWKIPWEKPGRLQSMGLQRVGHDWATSLHFKLVVTWMSSPEVNYAIPSTILWHHWVCSSSLLTQTAWSLCRSHRLMTQSQETAPLQVSAASIRLSQIPPCSFAQQTSNVGVPMSALPHDG